MKKGVRTEDRLIAMTLKIGAYSAFACIVTGLLLHSVARSGSRVTTIGIIILLATPVVRIIVAGFEFLLERDFKYALVSLGVLGIVALAYWLGV
jgi:uncharacterized membrane protein